MKPKRIITRIEEVSAMWRRIAILAGLLIISVGMIMTMAPPAHAATMYDDAIGYWNFDDGTANDGTANANNGAVYGATATSSGRIGGAFSYDGTNDYVEVANSASIQNIRANDSLTISLWLKAVDNGMSESKFIGSWNGNNDYLFFLREDALVFVAGGGWGNHADYGNYKATFNDDNWHYYAVTYDQSSTTNNVNMYVDGDLVMSANRTGEIPDGSTQTLRFGRGHDSTHWYEGVMDEVAMWDYALSADDIATLYDTGYISSGITTLGLAYDTSELNQLAYLYGTQGAGTLTIDNIIWSYASGLLPGDDGSKALGDAWTYGGDYYIKLGSGLKGETGGAAPEPVTVVALLAGALMGGLKVARKGMGRRA